MLNRFKDKLLNSKMAIKKGRGGGNSNGVIEGMHKKMRKVMREIL